MRKHRNMYFFTFKCSPCNGGYVHGGLKNVSLKLSVKEEEINTDITGLIMK